MPGLSPDLCTAFEAATLLRGGRRSFANFVIPDLIRDPRRQCSYGSRIESGMTMRRNPPCRAAMGRGTVREANGGGVLRRVCQSPSVSASRCHLPMAAPQGGSTARIGRIPTFCPSPQNKRPALHPKGGPLSSTSQQTHPFSGGATVIRTRSPELPGKPVNIASTRLGTIVCRLLSRDCASACPSNSRDPSAARLICKFSPLV